jgi:hypothetical protein
VHTLSWRRHGVALVGLVAAVAIVALVARSRGSNDAPDRAGAAPTSTTADAPAPTPQLPRGGRTLLPGHRIVAFYGAPHDRELGTLGIGTPAQAGRRLAATTARYQHLDPTTPTLPAMELIAVVAAGAPGRGGLYRTRQDDATIRRYLRAARRMKALLILDVQPGRSDFLLEARHLERWLRQPDVSLALDPEWRVDAPQIPGQVFGSVSAREVNAVSYWLANLVRRHRLPQKLLLLHRFTPSMIRDQAAIKRRSGLALAINVDGFGGRAIKRAKYRQLTRGAQGFFDGFKLFYEEDTDLLPPRQVLALRPEPSLVVYE